MKVNEKCAKIYSILSVMLTSEQSKALTEDSALDYIEQHLAKYQSE